MLWKPDHQISVLFSTKDVEFHPAAGLLPVERRFECRNTLDACFPHPHDLIAFSQARLSGHGIGGHIQDQGAVFIGQRELPHHGGGNGLNLQSDRPGRQTPQGGCPGTGRAFIQLESVDDLMAQQAIAPILVEHLLFYGYGSAGHHFGYRPSRTYGHMTLVAISPIGMDHFIFDIDGLCRRRGCRCQRKMEGPCLLPGAVPSRPC